VVGLWEPIVVHEPPPRGGPVPRERTSWLTLARAGVIPDAIAHWECPIELRPPRLADG
jgi:hypothetical protein